MTDNRGGFQTYGNHHKKKYRYHSGRMKAGQEKMRSNTGIDQGAVKAIQKKMRASQDRMEPAINSIGPNWRRP
jgi:hypothetical protein